jgi:putative ABC transport system ATP-binding protein/lipoprotein-releasing system ATP-binding protein
VTIVAKTLGKTLGTPPRQILSGIDCTINDGDFIAISGRSGSGKSTLLYVLSTLDHPSSGSLMLDGKETTALERAELYRLRNEKIGFVFQFHYLLPELSALENVLMPARKHGITPVHEDRARKLLGEFGLHDKHARRPSQLSGGEQQRVAIARALVMEPRYIFADEPTGSLDSENGRKVMDILQAANSDRGATLVLVTHEPDYARLARSEITLLDGHIIDRR